MIYEIWEKYYNNVKKEFGEEEKNNKIRYRDKRNRK